MKFFVHVLSAAVLLNLPAALSGGEETPSRPASHDERLEELEQRQKILERKHEIDREAQEEKAFFGAPLRPSHYDSPPCESRSKGNAPSSPAPAKGWERRSP